MTRRINSLLALFALTLFSFVLPVQAQEVEYELWVAGEKITSKNQENFTNDALIEGKVSYDPVKKELTLDNAVISTNSNEGIRSAINGLKIIVKGKCSITCGSESVLYVEKYTFIIGSSLADELALVCNSSAQYSSAAALKLDTTTCEIKNCSVVVESAYYSIGLGWYSSGGRSLILDNAKLSITGLLHSKPCLYQ